jgi:hypothetical protein
MNRDFPLKTAAMSALAEVVECPVEDKNIGQPVSTDGPFSLQQALKEIGPLPEEALFLGLAEDGLPVLLNLWDPAPGPILVAGDAHAGKTGLLQTLSRSAVATHDADEIQYGVITEHPDQWEADARYPHCIGIFSTGQRSVTDFIQALALWIKLKHSNRQSILLVIDGLEDFLSSNSGLAHGLQHILMYGPAKRIWPFITINLECLHIGQPWLRYFHTRVFGYTEHIDALNGDYSNAGFENLSRGLEFCMEDTSHWLKFRIPA